MFVFRSNKALADSLDQAVDPKDPLVNRLLRMMATQAMSNAVYFSTGACPEDQYYHYGTPHTFTSSIYELIVDEVKVRFHPPTKRVVYNL